MEYSSIQSSSVGGNWAAVVLALDGEVGTGKRSWNTHLLAGTPLEGWVLRSVLLSGQFDSVNVYVYTSQPDVAGQLADYLGARVFLSQRQQGSTDTPELSAAQEVLSQHTGVDGVVVIPCTSVLIQPHHVTEACRLIGEGYDSVMSVSKRDQAIWQAVDNGTEDPAMELSGQSAPHGLLTGPVIQPDGSDCTVNNLFFCATREVILSGRIKGDSVATVEIDTKYTPNLNLNHDSDWLLMEQRVMRIGCMDSNSLVPVRLVVFAGDSVVTDKQVYDGGNGVRYSSYNLSDVAGIRMLLEREIEVKIITETENTVVQKFAEKVGVNTTMLCASDKAGTVDTWRQERGLRWNRVAFMGGNSAGDLDCLRQVSGHGAVPCDSGPEAHRAATFVSSKAGGRGAVREFCNFLVALLDRISAEIEEAAL